MKQSIEEACGTLSRKHNLSRTECHILVLITRGHSPQEIADIRERSLETVRTQIKQIMQKLEVNRFSGILMAVMAVVE